MAITTTAELEAYLISHSIPYTSLSQLSGGTANFVWRLTTPTNQTFIVKHAEPYIASNALIAFPTSRTDNEHTALIWANSHLDALDADESARVSVPTVQRYLQETHTHFLEDVGTRTLKEAHTDPGIDIPSYGRRLGAWLAHLHSSTRISPFEINSAIARAIYRYSYSNLASALAAYGHDAALGKKIDDKYGTMLATDDVCICHGDFWPGNVMLAEGARISVVDWEIVRRGNGATDVGQFAAEAWLLGRFKGERGLLEGFLKGYREQSEVVEGGEVDLERVAVHMGSHLAFWPTRVEWANAEETKKVVAFGVDILRHVIDDDVAWVGREVFGGLLS